MSFRIVVNENKDPHKVIVKDEVVRVVVQSDTTAVNTNNVYI